MNGHCILLNESKEMLSASQWRDDVNEQTHWKKKKKKLTANPNPKCIFQGAQ